MHLRNGLFRMISGPSASEGQIGLGESRRSAAQREFAEETGYRPGGKTVPLGSAKQPGGKVVHVWAIEGDWVDSKDSADRARGQHLDFAVVALVVHWRKQTLAGPGPTQPRPPKSDSPSRNDLSWATAITFSTTPTASASPK